MSEEVSVYCWCGRAIVYVQQPVIDRCETIECRPGCKSNFERRGVRFEEGRRVRIPNPGLSDHPIRCRCSPECIENARAYYRTAYRRNYTPKNRPA